MDHYDSELSRLQQDIVEKKTDRSQIGGSLRTAA